MTGELYIGHHTRQCLTCYPQVILLCNKVYNIRRSPWDADQNIKVDFKLKLSNLNRILKTRYHKHI